MDKYATQTMKDYAIMVEYKHLAQYAPGGILVLPSHDSIRLWYGVIFVRRGLYAGGIFKFKYELPAEYPGKGTRPSVIFTSRVYHPLVDPQSGELELYAKFPEWDPELHYTVSVLTFIKKIFYMKDYYTEGGALNQQANLQFLEDKGGFERAAKQCVTESLEKRYENKERGSSLKFTPPKQQHAKLREQLHSSAREQEQEMQKAAGTPKATNTTQDGAAAVVSTVVGMEKAEPAAVLPRKPYTPQVASTPPPPAPRQAPAPAPAPTAPAPTAPAPTAPAPAPTAPAPAPVAAADATLAELDDLLSQNEAEGLPDI